MEEADLRAIATLDDDVRRALFAVVRSATVPVTREAAAAAVGISRKLAAFHLDKLVDAQLLSARIEAASPRRVGRAPKVYERGPRSVSVSIPHRESDLLATVLADAIENSPAATRTAAMNAARERGRTIGRSERAARGRGRTSRARHHASITAALARHGFEPVDDGQATRLRNCPFHAIAEQSTELVCGMNRELITGVVEGVGAERLFEATLAPEPGWCCVAIRDAGKNGR